jgi:hypothetical protein
MKKTFFLSICIIFTNFLMAQQNQITNFAYRNGNQVEKMKVTFNANMESIAFEYQGVSDKKFVKLNIIEKKSEEMKLVVERSDNKQKMTLSESWIMAGTQFLENGESKTFSTEIICKAATGEQLITSGGPMFLPFYYASNAKGNFMLVDVPQEQLGSGQTLPTGESYFEVTLPNKKGKYKIVPMPYAENDTTTKIKLLAPNGKVTIFKGK